MSILDNAKQIAEAVHDIQNLELYQRVLALHSDIIGMVEDNLALRSEVADLKKKLEIKGRLRVEATDRLLYYLEQENGERDGPFCTVCYDIDSKLVRAEPWSDGRYVCRFCNKFRNRQRS
jgi:regulator of replication initiation timing